MRASRSVFVLVAIVVFVAAAAAPALVVRAQSGITATVTADFLNVRKAPKVGYPILGVLAKGAVVTVIGRNSAGTWLEATTGFGDGWISSGWVTLTGGSIEQLPVTSTGLLPFVTGVSFEAVSIRSGPSTDFGVVGLLPYGATADVIGQDPTSTWLQVTSPFGDGWLLSKFVTITGNLFLAPNTDDMVAPVIKNVNYRVRVRTAPNTDSNVVGVLSYNEYATIIGISPDFKFWKIQASFGIGWVSASLVRAIGNTDNVPVVSQ